MLKIRLQRIGRRHDPQFRVLVTDNRNGPKSGGFIEVVGSYNAKLGFIQLDGERIKYWISVGAQVSDTVHNFLIREKIIEGKKINALPKKTAIISEKAAEPAPVAKTEQVSVEESTPVVETESVAEPVVEAPTETEEAVA